MTTNDLGNRQRGDLNGRLNPALQPAAVTIAVDGIVAQSRAGQHLLWMLTNLLARQMDEVIQLTVDVGPDAEVLPGISPLLPAVDSLANALAAAAQRINPHLDVHRATPPTVRLQIGGERADVDADIHTLYVSAASWSGYIGTVEAPWRATQDDNPIGPYIAACLAAAEVFKLVRGVQEEYGTLPAGTWYDAYHLTISAQGDHGPPLPQQLQGLPAVLAGVGAVGTALLHTLYAVSGLQTELIAVDNDPDGVDITNLNRYTLFNQDDLDQQKASQATQRLAGSGVTLTPRDMSWDAWAAAHSDDERDLVLSCVDNNEARHAIQRTMPGVILSASTSGMRAQVVAFERRPGEACLRCRNPVEARVSDEVVISRLRAQDAATRARLAENQGIHPDDLERYLDDPQKNCGLISGETLQRFGNGSGEHAWSVGFVSAMAGVMLAAEYLRRSLSIPANRLSRTSNLARFQFWFPDSPLNTTCHWPQAADCVCTRPSYRAAIAAHPWP